jgi:hypothetical protein
MKINTAAAGHTGPVKNGVAEWLAYDNKVDKQLKVLQKAMEILKNNVNGWKPCNDCFSKLPGGRTFDDIFADDTIWISYCPDNANYGFTNAVSGKEITICELAFRWGMWTVCGTLVHEMGHTNGAGTTDHAAEGTLLCCGLSKVHDPTIIGVRETGPSNIA